MKKNNLFKISLLLLVSNIVSDLNAYWTTDEAKGYDIYPEVKACRDGVKARARSEGVQLLTSYEDIKNVAGASPNTPLNTDVLKAAWIFGYNQNMTGYIGADGNSYMWDNNNDAGIAGYPVAPIEFGAIDGWGLATRSWLGPLEVCEYGFKIGWAFDAPKSRSTGILNFFKTSNTDRTHDLIGRNWDLGRGWILGEKFTEKAYVGRWTRRNQLQHILNSFNHNTYPGCACTGPTDSSPLTIDPISGLLK